MLRLAKGVIVYPADGSNHPRLPLLGLRAIMDNNLKLTIDGKRDHVSLPLAALVKARIREGFTRTSSPEQVRLRTRWPSRSRWTKKPR